MNRTQKSIKNLSYGMLYQIMYLVMTFAVRIAIIHCLGMTVLSLNGLFTEVLSLLTLSEMGVGMAITYSLYKPLAENDTKKITQLMNLFRKAYHIITVVMFGIGLCLIPFLKYIIKGVDVSWNYQVFVYLMFLINTCVSYLFSYKALLLTADQKAYVQAKLNLIIRLIFFVISLFMVCIVKNYAAYLFSEIGYSAVFYLIVARKADKMYPYINDRSEQLSPKETKEIMTSVKRVFVGKLSNRVLNSTDNLLISSLVGTVKVGIYGQYSMFINGFLRLFSQLNEAVVGGVGNIMAIESPKKAKETYDNLTYIFFILGSVSAVCMYVAIDPFLKFFIGDKYLLDESVLCVLMVNLFLETLKAPLWTYFNAAGLFKEEQYISLVGCVLNVIVSIIWGLKSGMYGIFMGTAVSLLLMIICKMYAIGQKSFNGAQREMTIDYAKYMIIFFVEMLAAIFCTNFSVNNCLFEFVLKGCIGLVITLIGSVFIFRRTSQYRYVMQIVERKLKKSHN